MDEKNLELLNNIILNKTKTGNLLEQQILANEDSLEIFDSDFHINKDEEKKNGLNIELNVSGDSHTKNTESKTRNKINGLNNDIPIQKKNISINSKKDNNKVNNTNTNNKKIKNKRNIEKNKDIDKNYFSDNDYGDKNSEKGKYNKSNKSVDYNVEKKYMKNKNNIDKNKNNGNDRINLYQRLFDIKMKNFENLKSKQNKQNNKKINKFNFINNIDKNQNEVLNSPYNQEIFSDDEKIQRKNESLKKTKPKDKTNNINIYNNYKNKSYLEDDDSITNKSKKDKVRSQSSLNSSMSNASSEKFLRTFERFKEIQKKQKEKIDDLKKKKEDNEKKCCIFIPKINKKSRNIKDDFYTRQKKKNEELKKKKENLKLSIT